MRKFYFLRHEDVNGFSGTGVVAEGVIFDDGTGAFTWLTPRKTVTTFWDMADIDFMHGHNGKTDVIIEGRDPEYKDCEKKAKAIKAADRIRRNAEERDE